MTNPTELKYSKDHEWIKGAGSDEVTIGITHFAQEQLGGLVFINLPEVGDEVTVGETFCDVESVKAVSDVYSPVTGVITAVNEDLSDSPEQINDAPYEAWLIKVGSITDTEELMDADAYQAFCDAQ